MMPRVSVNVTMYVLEGIVSGQVQALSRPLAGQAGSELAKIIVIHR